MIEGIKRREFGAGISANVDAMARFGYLWLRGGQWNGSEILPRDFIESARTASRDVVGVPVRKPDEYGNASAHYGLLWWNVEFRPFKNVFANTAGKFVSAHIGHDFRNDLRNRFHFEGTPKHPHNRRLFHNCLHPRDFFNVERSRLRDAEYLDATPFGLSKPIPIPNLSSRRYFILVLFL